LWIEEPVLPEDITGYRTVADAVPTAIAGGEALGSLIAYRDFVTAGAFSILQPDMAVCGGYSGFRNIWALGQAYDLPVMPHVFGTTVNFHASLQMASLIEARRGGGPEPYPFMEYDMMDNPLLSLCGTTQLDAQGRLAVPDGIGTGIELKPEMLEQWITSHWVEKV
jgi:D-galactarolactone cycloisomerase